MAKNRNIGSLPISEKVKEVISDFMKAEFIVVVGHSPRNIELFRKTFLDYIFMSVALSDHNADGQVSALELSDTLLQSSKMFEELANPQYHQFSGKLEKLAILVKGLGLHELG